MSAEPPAYSPLYVKCWAVLSVVLAFVFFGLFVFGDPLLHTAGIVWSVLRWLASPII